MGTRRPCSCNHIATGLHDRAIYADVLRSVSATFNVISMHTCPSMSVTVIGMHRNKCRPNVQTISHSMIRKPDNGWFLPILHSLACFLAERCNCIAKFGYCHDRPMLSVVCLSVTQVYFDETAEAMIALLPLESSEMS